VFVLSQLDYLSIGCCISTMLHIVIYESQ